MSRKVNETENAALSTPFKYVPTDYPAGNFSRFKDWEFELNLVSCYHRTKYKQIDVYSVILICVSI